MLPAIPPVAGKVAAGLGYTGNLWGLSIAADKIYTGARRKIRQFNDHRALQKRKIPKDEQREMLEQPVFASKGKHSDIHDPDDIGKAFTKEMRAEWRGNNDLFSGSGMNDDQSPFYALRTGLNNKGNRGPRPFTGSTAVEADRWIREMGGGATNPISGEQNRPALHSRNQPLGFHNIAKMHKPETPRHGTVGGFRPHNYKPKRRSKFEDQQRGRLTFRKPSNIHDGMIPQKPFGGKKEKAMQRFLKAPAARMHTHRTDVDYVDEETRFDPFHDYTQNMPKTPKPWDSKHYGVQELLSGKKTGLVKRMKNWLRPDPVQPLTYGALTGAIDSATGIPSMAAWATGKNVGMVFSGSRDPRKKKPKSKTGLPRNFDPGGA